MAPFTCTVDMNIRKTDEGEGHGIKASSGSFVETIDLSVSEMIYYLDEEARKMRTIVESLQEQIKDIEVELTSLAEHFPSAANTAETAKAARQ